MSSIATMEQYATYAARWGLEVYTADLEDALAGATAEAQEHCGREFLPSPVTVGQTETRYYVGDGTGVLFVDDLLTLASISVTAEGGATPTETVAYKLEPRGKTPTTHISRTLGTVWTDGSEIAVTGRFGYAEIASLPEPLVRAVCMLAAMQLNGGEAMTRDMDGIRSERALMVQVDYAAAPGQATRSEALELLNRYKRLF